MKKIIVIAIIIIIGFVSCSGRVAAKKNPLDDYYVRGAVVTAVHQMDTGEYLIELEDSILHAWGFYDTENYWSVGDIACMVMDRMDTEDMNDDEVTDVYHSGFKK